ncbi:hypothetical protein MMC10_001174 [Thelotrema lepadinum]|nr:hypothetical protein [Thelotrema lepadinum]
MRISIKNTGHDYLGRSSSPNSLAIWTANLKNMAYKADFTAYKCPASSGHNIGIVGAGVVGSEAVAFFNKYGMDVTAGQCPSVGIAGGYAQGGGHSIYGPSYGLMADQAVEMDVIIPSGIFLTINACNSADLFWALRGGGGSTFAVVINYKFQLHPSSRQISLSSIRATFPPPPSGKPSSSPNLRALYTFLATNQPLWSANKIAGYYFLSPTSAEIYHVLPTGPNPPTTLQNLTTSPLHTLLSSLQDTTILESSTTSYQNQTAFYAAASPIQAKHGAVGLSISLSSRLIPTSLFSPRTRQTRLVESFLAALDTTVSPTNSTAAAQLKVELGIYATTPVSTPDVSGETAVNPAWRRGMWHVVGAGGWVQGMSPAAVLSTQNAVRRMMEPIIQLVGSVDDSHGESWVSRGGRGGRGKKRVGLGEGRKRPSRGYAYVNEGDVMEGEWREVFYGRLYERLLAVKRRWDKNGVLGCWKCVGWRDGQEEE